jgi:Reverse transcriptase (RNA-dependent DNA polymerase)
MALMNDVFGQHLDVFVIIYLDDILIYNRTKEKHLNHIRIALETLRQHQLYAKMSKCEFCLDRVDYPGHILSTLGLSVGPEKISAIKDWPVPKSKTDVQSFFGNGEFLASVHTRLRRHFPACQKETFVFLSSTTTMTPNHWTPWHQKNPRKTLWHPTIGQP